MNAEQLFQEEKQKCNDIIREYNNLEEKIKTDVSDKEKLEKKVFDYENLNIVFSTVSKELRDKAKNSFQKIVTEALQFVAQDNDYSFVIQESIIRGKPAYEFYIKKTVNGEESLQRPEFSNGGGFVDIISVTGKIAYLQIFNNPKIMNACYQLDEPGKMISEQMSVKFAEYIKFLGKQFGLQIIMITHNENLANIADNALTVIDGKVYNYTQDVEEELNLESVGINND